MLVHQIWDLEASLEAAKACPTAPRSCIDGTPTMRASDYGVQEHGTLERTRGETNSAQRTGRNANGQRYSQDSLPRIVWTLDALSLSLRHVVFQSDTGTYTVFRITLTAAADHPRGVGRSVRSAGSAGRMARGPRPRPVTCPKMHPIPKASDAYRGRAGLGAGGLSVVSGSASGTSRVEWVQTRACLRPPLGHYCSPFFDRVDVELLGRSVGSTHVHSPHTLHLVNDCVHLVRTQLAPCLRLAHALTTLNRRLRARLELRQVCPEPNADTAGSPDVPSENRAESRNSLSGKRRSHAQARICLHE